MSALTKTRPTDSVLVAFHLPEGPRHVRLPLKNAKALLAFVGQKEDGPVSTASFVKKEVERVGGQAALALRGYRIRKGLTQKELANETDILPTHLSMMEKGKRKVTAKTAKALAKILNCKWQKLASDVLEQESSQKAR